jgi:hyperosmotically inducible periplasmic protein
MRSMHWKSLLAAVGMSLLAAPVFADQPQDAYLTSKVKIQLMKADGITNAMSINVDTLDSVVTLQGKVETAAEREKAAQEARGVKGVKEVRDMLAVVPKSAKEQVNASDDQIQKRIETVFEQDAALKESSIKVASVNKGNVVLSGKADTLSSHQRAITDARGVPGVRKVASEIQSPDKLGDKEIWSDEPSTAAQAKSSASDTWVTTKVKTKLLAEPGLNPLKINVDTRDGIVTLFGNVNSANDRTVAEQQTRKIDGVKSVQNELQVVAESAEKTVAARDDQLQDAVKKRIGEREGLKDDNIDIEVKNGVVRLTGTVDGFGDRMTALTVARSTKGVKSVIDDLRIEQKG